MDIPDVEVVVVYGSPKTATQLYQVDVLMTFFFFFCLLIVLPCT